VHKHASRCSGHAFCRCAMTCASEFASAFAVQYKISRYYYDIIIILYRSCSACSVSEVRHLFDLRRI